MSLSKEVDLAHAQRPVPCDACEDEIPGIYYCKQCKKTLCEECEKFHKKFTKGHNVVPRSQIAEVDNSTLSCTNHENEAFFHCEKCNVPVCPDCVTGIHQGHKMANLKDIMQKKKEFLQDKIDKIENIVLPKLIRQEAANDMERENYNKKIQQLKKDMEDANKVIHQELDRIHHERLDSLDDTQLDQLSLFDDRAAEIRMIKDLCKIKVSEYQDVIRKNQFQAINNLMERKETLPEVQNKSQVPELPFFDPPNVQRLVENFGKLRISSHLLMENPMIVSEFKCPLKGFPRIYATREGEVWLGGHKEKELVMVDIKGKILQKRKLKTAPYMLAGLECGDVIIIPQKDESVPVIRLLADGREQDVFDPSPSNSNGISVTADQKLLICTVDGKVFKTNKDGSHVKLIYKESSGSNSIRFALENKDGNIYISSRSMHAVVIIDKDGKVLSTISNTVTGETFQEPLGLVQDRFGNILCADQVRKCVYIIDRNRQVRELLGPEIIPKLKLPRNLVVDNDDNLWITQRDGTVFVLKYVK